MKMYQLFCFILILTLSFHGNSQNYADKSFYLIDSLNIKDLIQEDKITLDSCLLVYHKTNQDTSKVNAISFFIINGINLEVGSRYNLWLSTFLIKKIKTESNKSVILHFRKAYSRTICNIGYTYFLRGENDNALKKYNIALKLSHDLGAKNIEATTLNNIGLLYASIGEYKIAINNYKKSSKIFKDINYKIGEGSVINNLGTIYYSLGNNSEALFFFHQGLEIQKELGVKKGIATGYNNIAHLYYVQGDINRSIEYHYKALKMREAINDKNGVATSYNNLALLFESQNNLDKAIVYLEKSKQIFINIDYKQGVANTLNNIANLQKQTNHSSDALLLYEQALKIEKELGNKQGIANNLNDIGLIHQLKNDYKKAITFFNESILIKEKIEDKEGIAISLNNLGAINIVQNNLKLASINLQKAFIIANQVGSPDLISSIAHNLQDLAYLKKDYKTAYDMYNIHITMRDSIVNEKNLKETIQQQSKYEYEKQKDIDSINHQKQVLILNLENEKIENEKLIQKQNNQIVLFSILVVFILLTVLFIVYRQRIKSKAIQLETDFQKLLLEQSTKLNEGKQIERDRIASELHDGIGSQLNGVFMQLDLLTDDDNSKQYKYVTELQKIGKRIRELSHQMTDSGQEVEASLPQLIADLCTLNVTPNFSVEYYSDDALNSIQFNKNAIIQIYYIIQEALNNILKHAQASHSEISIKKLNNQLELIIKDNGKGFTTNQKEGFGLKSIKKRSKLLNGNCSFSTDNGLVIKIKFPIKSVAL